METIISSPGKEIIIGTNRPTVLIGERINPSGRKKLAAALQTGDMDFVCREAIAQVEAGADILDINVGTASGNDLTLLPRVIQAVMAAVDVPLSIDSDNALELEAALKVYQGKPIINSVTGEDKSLDEVLPLVKKYGAAVIALTIDNDGIPAEADRRVAVAHIIIEHAEKAGIPREDIIFDCLTLAAATDSDAASTTLESVRRVRDELGANQTLGSSNISFGLPDRDILNNAFLAAAIMAGATCPTVNAARVRPTVLATDFLLGRDRYAQRYIRAYRKRQAG